MLVTKFILQVLEQAMLAETLSSVPVFPETHVVLLRTTELYKHALCLYASCVPFFGHLTFCRWPSSGLLRRVACLLPSSTGRW
jgi:hypothetical protein